jgi:hypothetical protein
MSRHRASPPIPVKTADGQAELSNRQRRLSQRHRSVLLLVDGRRSEAEVRRLARQAGAGDSCFGELIDEVEARIVKPYRSLAAQQTLRRARHLLVPRVDAALPTG